MLFDCKSVLLFGENGTGKSSFVDAFEKLFTGRVSTLDGRAQGLSSDRHGPHIRNVGSPPRIAVTFDDPASSTFAQDSAPASLPLEIQKYVESARENLYILRRRQVLEFIDCQPRERYDLLRPFLPLSGIEAMENAIRAARERAESEAQRAGQEVGRYISLERLIEQTKERYYEPLEQNSTGWHEGQHDPWPFVNYLLFILKTAYREFEERVGQTAAPRGAKTELVANAIGKAIGPFSVADLQRECPGVGLDMIRSILKKLRAEGKVECLGRGQHARWRKTPQRELGSNQSNG